MADLKINYIHVSKPSKLFGTEAVLNEIELIKKAFPHSYITNLYPLHPFSEYRPRFSFGLENLAALKKKDDNADINHVFAPTLAYYFIFRFLKKPIIYTITAGITGDQVKEFSANWVNNNFVTIVVSSNGEKELLTKNGINNVSVVEPGINFKPAKSPLNINNKVTLLVASGPWTNDQLYTKGFDVILKSLQLAKKINVIFLLRGLYEKELKRMVEKHAVQSQIEIINERVNIQQLLAGVHGSMLLAKDSRVIKSYPHSIMESLLSAKPVIVSANIALGHLVNKNNWGIVIDDLSVDKIINGFEKFVKQYDSCRVSLDKLSSDTFSYRKMIKDYSALYCVTGQ